MDGNDTTIRHMMERDDTHLNSALKVANALKLLKHWHRWARGHHPEESCCVITEAISLLEKV